MSTIQLVASSRCTQGVTDGTEILCTLGPASLDARIIRRLEQSGASLFRVNLSHTGLGDLLRVIGLIRAATTLPLCLDTEGA